jgi:hypothetical protein
MARCQRIHQEGNKAWYWLSYPQIHDNEWLRTLVQRILHRRSWTKRPVFVVRTQEEVEPLPKLLDDEVRHAAAGAGTFGFDVFEPLVRHCSLV